MIDLRSDTVTKPTPAMRKAMAEAEVGDDVFDDDPTVHRLQDLAAELTGHEAALFCASGTQCNLIALMTHCGRGDEYIVGHDAHTFKYEAGGAAVLASIQPQTVTFEPDSTLDLEKVAAVIKPDDPHFARTRVLCLENTHHGQVVGTDYLRAAGAFTGARGLALHLDGARVPNAAVALGLPLAEVTGPVDSVSMCLSKGLGAPVGSVLCGTADFITRAKRNRKILGGGMRQAGVLAAAGIEALNNHIDRLADDHDNATALATGLADIDGVEVEAVDTNMVFATFPDPEGLARSLASHGILVLAGSPMRLVTHLDIGRDDIDTAIGVIRHNLHP